MNQFTPTTRPLLLFFCYRVLSILRVTRPFSTWSRRSMRRRHGTFRLLAVHWTCACGCACASAYMSVPSRNSTAAPFPRVSIATRQEHSGWLWTTEHNGEKEREREKEKERAGQMKCEIHFMRARSSTRFRHFFSSPFHSLLFSSLLFYARPLSYSDASSSLHFKYTEKPRALMYAMDVGLWERGQGGIVVVVVFVVVLVPYESTT